MAYWRLFYHFVWTTKDRLPLLVPEIEPNVYRFLHAEANKLHVQHFTIGGVADHVHVVAAVPPALSPAAFMKQLKGSSSRFVTVAFGRPFEWQEGYGVLSISEGDVARVLEYVRNQKSHHAYGHLIDEWEQAHHWNVGPGMDPLQDG